jgi:pimeloyl-ACP methyl ester carboxylesterase
MLKKIILGLLVFILLALFVGPFLIPVPPLENTVSAHELADPDSKFSEVLGLEIHYKEFGTGEPALILLHGFGSSEYSWREVTAPMAEYGRVIAFDRPAFGLTERPLEWETLNPYSAEFQPQVVVGLMDVLGIQEAILVGNSAGGTVAMNTYLAYPKRISGLVLVDAAVFQGGGTPAIVRPLLNTPQVNHLGPLIARNIQNWGRDFAESAWFDPSKITDEIWEGYSEPLQVHNWDIALWELTRASRSSNLSEKLDQFVLPTLVIAGDNDRIVPAADSIRLADELPQAELVVIPACGHVPHEECPQEFLAAITEFLDRFAE